MQLNYIIPIFVPHIGCPNDCVFCNQRKITGISTDVTPEDVKNKIEEYLKTIPEENRNLEVAFFGGSFTGIETEIQKALLDTAYSYKKKGIVNNIRLSTRPDYIDTERLDILKERGVDIIELGIQSLNPEVLKKSNRGHDRESVFKAAELIKEYGFTLGVQMMLGLPGDNEERALKTADELISLEPSIARIYPTLVIKETELERDYLSGKYEPISIEDSVNLAKKILYKFEKNGITVIRIGLQPSDNITEGGDVVAGPFHPAFRQLVESEMYYDAADRILDEMGKENIENSYIIFEIEDRFISYLSGQKKKNSKKLKEKYGLKNIKIRGNSSLKGKIKASAERDRKIFLEKTADFKDTLDKIYSEKY